MGKDVELTFLSEAFDEVCKFTGCETINAEINGVITDKKSALSQKLQQSSHLEGYSEISDREFKANFTKAIGNLDSRKWLNRKDS